MEQARYALQKIMCDAIRRLPAAEIPLAAWQLAAGSAVGEKTKALAFEAGILTIEVPDVTWRAQLRDMAAQFLSRLNQYSSVRVERIEFVLPRPQDAK